MAYSKLFFNTNNFTHIYGFKYSNDFSNRSIFTPKQESCVVSFIWKTYFHFFFWVLSIFSLNLFCSCIQPFLAVLRHQSNLIRSFVFACIFPSTREFCREIYLLFIFTPNSTIFCHFFIHVCHGNLLEINDISHFYTEQVLNKKNMYNFRFNIFVYRRKMGHGRHEFQNP